MGKEFRMKLEKVFDFLGELLAFVVAVVWVLVVLNANFHFLNGVPVLVNIFSLWFKLAWEFWSNKKLVRFFEWIYK